MKTRPSLTKKLIESVFSQPTAPFREGFVLEALEGLLLKHKLPYFYDTHGNLLAGVKKSQIRATRKRLALFSHTDHPGFHLTKKLTSTTYRAIWYGGAPFDTMRGSKIRVHDPAIPGVSVAGKITKLEKVPYSRDGIPITIKLNHPFDFSPKAYGAFDFPGFEFKGDRIRARAADDLAGCVIALESLIREPKKVLAVFTRGEEVGFVGCIGLLESKILPKEIHCVSLEASRTLPGAIIGEGPVLRLGDRTTLFDTEFSNVFHMVAAALNKKDKTKFQRRIMDGGSCEATAISVYGYPTTGLAVPLGNYHNQGKTKPAAEVVSLKDVERGVDLCTELAKNISKKLSWEKPFKKQILQNFRNLKPLLK